MLAMASQPSLGLPGIYGVVIVAGVSASSRILCQPVLPLFPPVVTGSIITVIGITLMRVGINWAGGGVGSKDRKPRLSRRSGSRVGDYPTSAPFCARIVSEHRSARRHCRGSGITIGLGWSRFDGLGAQPWIAIVYPFQFGPPVFDVVAGLSMCLVMVVVMIESLGMFLALGEIVGRELIPADLSRGLRADGLHTLIGGILNTFPYTSFSQNMGLVGVTGVGSPLVCVGGGVIRCCSGWFPRVSRLRRQPTEPVHRRNLDRLRHDTARIASALQGRAGHTEADAGQRHSAGDDRRCRAERLFQSRLSARGCPFGRGACDTRCGSRLMSVR